MEESLVLVMPAYKEITGLKSFIPEIRSAFIRYNLRILIIDDASQDGTKEYFSNADSGVFVSENHSNIGHGPSLLRGLNLSLDFMPTHVMTVDGDGQFTGLEMLAFWEGYLKSQYTLGEAIRIRYDEPAFRRITSKITRLLVKLKTGLPTSDANTPLRVYEVKILMEILGVLNRQDKKNPNPAGRITPNLLISIWTRKKHVPVYQSQVRFQERRGESSLSISWHQRFTKLPSKKFIKFCLKAFIEVKNF